MKKINTIFLLFFGIYSQVALSQDNDHVPGELLIMLEGKQDPQVLATELSLIGNRPSQLTHQRILSKSLNIHLFSFDPSLKENSMLASVLAHPSVRIAQYNHYVSERNTVPNDPQFNVMWGMDNTGTNGGAGAVADADIDAPEAWDITTGGLTALGDSIVVAVIDGGFSLTHPDLNFWKNYDEIPDNGIDDDGNGYIDDFNGWNAASQSDNWTPQSHGTHVAGTVGARGNNGVGVTGVNWNVKVMPIVYGSGGSFEANVVAAYAFARDQRMEYNQTNGAKGAFVVATNSSFGVDLAQPSAYPIWCAMYDSLGAVGILSAGATANANYNVDVQGDIPTACPSDWLVTVTNTRSNDTKTSSAGYGATTIDLGSPGSGIMSTYYSSGTNTYNSISGTSMATPHVAGAIALMYSVVCPEFITNYKSDPAGIALMIKDSLLGAVDPVAALSGITVTGGRLNLFNAVKSVQNYCLRLGVEESENEKPYGISKVYPNPANDVLNVLLNSSGGQNDIVISNVVGQVVKIISDNSNGPHSILIDVKDLSPGLYFVKASNQDFPSSVLKVIIK